MGLCCLFGSILLLTSLISIHGFKSIGYVRLFDVPPTHSSSFIPNRTPALNRGVASTPFIPAIFFATVILAAAFVMPYFSSLGAPSRL